MESWLNWQMNYLLALQHFRQWSSHIFDRFFLKITLFGELMIPLLVICFMYWCLNKKAGLYLMFSCIAGFLFGFVLKNMACIYRPWILNRAIEPLSDAVPAAGGYSFPSGHSINATTIWGSIAISFWAKKWVRYGAFFLIIAVMFSRNFVGVHTPQDVLMGLIVGLLTLYGVNKVLVWESQRAGRDKVIVGLWTVLCIIIPCYTFLKSYPLDYDEGVLLFDPHSNNRFIVGRLGVLLGIVYGWFIEKNWIHFTISHKRIKRFIAGILPLLFLYAFAQKGWVMLLGQFCGTFVHFLILGLYITAIFPYITRKLHL